MTPVKTTLKVSVFMKPLRTANLQQQIALKPLTLGRDSSVGIAAAYGLVDPRIEFPLG